MFFLDKILRNVSIVVMVAFGAHEKTRIQLAGAIKLCASAGEKRHAEVREERGNSASCRNFHSTKDRKNTWRLSL